MKYFVETVGWVAAGMMLTAYILLTLGRLSSKAGIYHWLNILSGAGFILNIRATPLAWSSTRSGCSETNSVGR